MRVCGEDLEMFPQQVGRPVLEPNLDEVSSQEVGTTSLLPGASFYESSGLMLIIDGSRV